MKDLEGCAFLQTSFFLSATIVASSGKIIIAWDKMILVSCTSRGRSCRRRRRNLLNRTRDQAAGVSRSSTSQAQKRSESDPPPIADAFHGRSFEWSFQFTTRPKWPDSGIHFSLASFDLSRFLPSPPPLSFLSLSRLSWGSPHSFPYPASLPCPAMPGRKWRAEGLGHPRLPPSPPLSLSLSPPFSRLASFVFFLFSPLRRGSLIADAAKSARSSFPDRPTCGLSCLHGKRLNEKGNVQKERRNQTRKESSRPNRPQ